MGSTVKAPATEAGSTSAARLASVDMLRGAAILWIVLYHLW